MRRLWLALESFLYALTDNEMSKGLWQLVHLNIAFDWKAFGIGCVLLVLVGVLLIWDGRLPERFFTVGKVSELDLDDVEATSHPLDLVNVWGEDEPRASLPLDEALANAPEREDDFFRVPPSAAVEDAP